MPPPHHHSPLRRLHWLMTTSSKIILSPLWLKEPPSRTPLLRSCNKHPAPLIMTPTSLITCPFQPMISQSKFMGIISISTMQHTPTVRWETTRYGRSTMNNSCHTIPASTISQKGRLGSSSSLNSPLNSMVFERGNGMVKSPWSSHLPSCKRKQMQRSQGTFAVVLSGA